MTHARLLLSVSLLALVSCRTEIRPVLKAEEVKTVRMVNAKCDVHDYPAGTDVPAGAKKIGPLELEREGNDDDETTFAKMRLKVCAMGGDAISSMSWERESGQDRPHLLRATVWELP